VIGDRAIITYKLIKLLLSGCSNAALFPALVNYSHQDTGKTREMTHRTHTNTATGAARRLPIVAACRIFLYRDYSNKAVGYNTNMYYTCTVIKVSIASFC
jgi:hypothetical protein